MAYEPKHGTHLEPGTTEYQAALDKLLALADRTPPWEKTA